MYPHLLGLAGVLGESVGLEALSDCLHAQLEGLHHLLLTHPHARHHIESAPWPQQQQQQQQQLEGI
jgi:hypothetical protein